MIDAKERTLFICESPNKVKTISQILKELGYTNVVVQASVGHITHIADSGEFNMGIDPKTFKIDFAISDDKKEIVRKLKEHDLIHKNDIVEMKRLLLNCFQKVGIVKYDAFREMGGQLSFSIAMLDQKDNGFVMNSVHSASSSYVYTKEIENGRSAIELSDEEKEALQIAINSSPSVTAMPSRKEDR